MRPAIPYSADELLEFAELLERTKDAAEELEDTFLHIQEEKGLSKKKVLFTMARLTDSFIRMEEDFCFDESKRIDAEAVFNDYFAACREIETENEGDDLVTSQGNN